ncbi:MAG TPA: HAMP domain-containing sensor histidine kinase [Methylophilaceae bacterium]|nr:HAMP domain-containing sensor histidine kinase [Methylophilaceae bacterium]
MNKPEQIRTNEFFNVDIAAAYIHDVKNNLNFLMTKADLEQDMEAMQVLMDADFKLNNLLVLYKAQGDMLSVQVDAVSPLSMLRMLAVSYQPITKKQLIVQEGDESLIAYIDQGLIELCLGNAIHNADRFARDEIHLSVKAEEGMTVFKVSDDGDGYPANIIASGGSQVAKSSSSSGLGFYLSSKIASQHVNNGEQGFIRLRNDGGAVFEMFLP